jgi:hypothetical protein
VADTEDPLFPDEQPDVDRVKPAPTDDAQYDEVAQPAEAADVVQSVGIVHVPQPVEVVVDGPPQPGQVELQDTPEPRRLSRAEQEQYDRTRRRFAACGRCGYFLGDLQLYLGEENLQLAILASRDSWVRLEGDETFRRLLLNAYGVQLDVGYDYFDSTCPECRRRFVFAKQEDGPARLKILVNNPN